MWFRGARARKAVYGLPRNYATGAAYLGINAFLLHFSGALPFFLTFKQALALGSNVRKGAEGHPIVYYNVSVRENEQTKLPFLRYYTVFLVEDIEGIAFNLPELERPAIAPSRRLAAEPFISRCTDAGQPPH